MTTTPRLLNPQIMHIDSANTNLLRYAENNTDIGELTYSKRLNERLHDVRRKSAVRKRYARHHRHHRSELRNIITPVIIRKSILAHMAQLIPEHKLMPLSCVSAAAILGAPIPEKDVYCSLYMATNIKKNSQHAASCIVHNSLPIRQLYINYSMPKDIRKNLLSTHHEDFEYSLHSSRGLEESCIPRYEAINDEVGVCSGILVTSPLQTMFDCMRVLPFCYGLAICDHLSALYDISSEDMTEFLHAHKSCKSAQIAAYRLEFVDKNSTSYYESLCRALMIKAGVSIPLLHSQLPQALSTNFPLPCPASPDFIWELPSFTTRTVNTPARYIIAHIDGFKYFHSLSTGNETSSSHILPTSYRQLEELLAVSNCTIVRLSTREISVEKPQRLIEKLRKAYVPFVSEEEIETRVKYLSDRRLLRF
ncbi:hypothetical protein EJ419_00075 [Alloscardovia theropitheci]|uniref:Uncharacterized protein n=1 Tax=Alloscardovia theropitheci TaxID=2496842 RepID=A0A4R0QTZ9_9BIFI|nr:hypothetical protein [Alloscardovia theropitheci]TCD55038.1 hypothetical protein EJ419_00075 [Alloscardovia theropitheci]